LMITCDVSKDKVFRERVANIVDEKSLSAKAKSAEAILDIEHVESNDVACVLYTSGTTGLPKGAMLTHGCLSTNAEALVDEWRFTEHDKLLHMLPFYHVHGMFISLNCSLFSHSTVIWRERFSVEDSIKLLPSTTVLMGVPTFYSYGLVFFRHCVSCGCEVAAKVNACSLHSTCSRLLSSPKFNAELLQQLRLFTCGSAPLSTQLWKEFKSRTGHEILERYGMTEAQVISSNLYDDRRPGTVGKPVGDTKIRISDRGIVEIQSSSLFSGYWKNPKKTAEDFTEDKYFTTGDLGTIDDDGTDFY
uniref:AMP-binding domain-containing protein n=1 Tax=Heligmosomoides polygyrus TaxID=6339 RepID=A0A8L8Q1J5_HELPZ